jgi:aconitate hydratase
MQAFMEALPIEDMAAIVSIPCRLPGAGNDAREISCVDLSSIDGAGASRIAELPFCLRVVLENVARTMGEEAAGADDLRRVLAWTPGAEPFNVPMCASRLILPDSSGLPALLDLAALRSTLVRSGIDPVVVQPTVPVDLVVDHSLIVDFARRQDAVVLNVRREYERNHERYRFLKWAQQAFDGLRIVPPGMGIVHQVHIERLARIVGTERRGGRMLAFPEFVLGGDSHTPMANGLGILAWGVGGVEIEAAMLGTPSLVQVPRVVGVRLVGELGEGVTTTDLVLAITQRLRRLNVVGDFVEFCGPGLASLSVQDRATIANMAPEYGATIGFFPIDANTLDYLHQTGRSSEEIALVEAYAQAVGLFRFEQSPEPLFSEIVEIDLSAVEASLAGPRRPQDRLALGDVAADFRRLLKMSNAEGGFGISPDAADTAVPIEIDGARGQFGHGSLAIAAITACTNTSNPGVMLAAGLLARKAAEAGLSVAPWIKTSLAPGSRVVTRYLEESGLLAPLEQLGFYVVGYGCTTCSGKSGPLVDEVTAAIDENGLVATAVLSGNRNFEGRIHRRVRANYLASPPLVVAYALAGRIDVDFATEPLGIGAAGTPVFLHDVWPSRAEITAALAAARNPAFYRENYAGIFDGTDLWQALDAPVGPLFPWPEDSTYLVEPPFFSEARFAASAHLDDRLENARVLGLYGDSLTTDHITPAGEIPVDSPAGKYLLDSGVPQAEFNAYTQRRGNHHVMMRGTYANIRIRNHLVPDTIGGVTRVLPDGAVTSIYDAAASYRERGTPMLVMGGRDFGMGSSRDWAAKGPALLGVRAVLARSFERIHRANLIALGIVPLLFRDGESWQGLGLDGTELYTISGLRDGVSSARPIRVVARRGDGTLCTFEAEAAIISTAEAVLLERGGMFAAVHARFRKAGTDNGDRRENTR